MFVASAGQANVSIPRLDIGALAGVKELHLIRFHGVLGRNAQ